MPQLNDTELIEKLESDPVYFIELFCERQLSDKQKTFIENTKIHKHVVAIWSRQTGKSTVIASYILWRLLYGKGAMVHGEQIPEKIAVLAPIKDQLKNLYDKLRTLIDRSDLILSFIDKINTAEIIAKNGNKIVFMSASPGSHIRGFTATCIVIDESQDVTDSKYSADILPFGATTNALIIEAGTPKQKNHFYNTIKAANISVVRQPWFECPFLSREYVMAQKAVSPDTLWRQEYLCEFIEEGVIVFPSKLFEPEIKEGLETGRWNLADYEIIRDPGQLTKEIVEKIAQASADGATRTMGIDLGKTNDNTVCTIYRTDLRPVRMEVKIKFPLDTQYMEVARIVGMFYKVFQPYEVNLDYTNEKGFLEMLKENDVPITEDPEMRHGAISFTTKNKTEMINTARLILEQYQLQIPKSEETLISQFMNQEFEISEGGKYKYFHPSNEHDDELWSTLLALKNVTLLSPTEILNFINPWEKHDERVHGADRKTAREVMFASNAIRRDNRNFYMDAESRRNRNN